MTLLNSRDVRGVVAFHERFGLPNEFISMPMSRDKVAFRVPFLHEELKEFEDAWGENLVMAADALLDLAYVAIGTALFIGASDRQRSIYPHFTETHLLVKGASMIAGRQPRFLTIGVHQHMVAAMKSRIQLFELAHDAAVIGELNALQLALHNLRDLVSGCHATAALMGIPWDICFEHVQQANMAKKRAADDGSNSKRNSPWDVVKPAGWSAPDAMIARTLLEFGWDVRERDIEINFKTGKVVMSSDMLAKGEPDARS